MESVTYILQRTARKRTTKMIRFDGAQYNAANAYYIRINKTTVTHVARVAICRSRAQILRRQRCSVRVAQYVGIIYEWLYYYIVHNNIIFYTVVVVVVV